MPGGSALDHLFNGVKALGNPARIQGPAVIFCYPFTGRPGYPNPPNWDHITGAHGSTPQAIAYSELNTADAYVRGVGQIREGINRFWPTYPVGIYPVKDGWLAYMDYANEQGLLGDGEGFGRHGYSEGGLGRSPAAGG